MPTCWCCGMRLGWLARLMAEELERNHVQRVYSQIAPHFSDTRYKPWPRIAQFLTEQPAGSLIADIGCGNGKYLGVNPRVFMLGSDICPELVSIARGRGHEVAVCDCLNLPYRPDLFDALICVAVIHHLSTEERRACAVREMARVLRPGGRMLLYVWAMEQERRKFASQDVMVPWHLQPKYSGQARSKVKSAKRQQGRREAGCRGQRDTDVSRSPGVTGEGIGSDRSSAVGSESSRNPTLLQDTASVCADTEEKVEEKQETEEEEENTLTKPWRGDGMKDGRPVVDTEDGGASIHSVPRSDLCDLGYQTFQRYYHVFQHGELSTLVAMVSSLIITEEFYDHDNWCVVAEKVAS